LPRQQRLAVDSPQPGLFAGADVRGTNQTVALARGDGTLLATLRRRTPPGGTAQDVLANVLGMLRDGLGSAGMRDPRSELIRIGIGFGGPVDQKRGTVVDSHHVPGWTDFPLRDTVALELGAPVVLENDANAAALGEARFGAGRGHHSVLYVNVGTGIGAGIVLDGRIYGGTHGMAGEIGHVTVAPDGPQCDCGKRGCLEALASGRSIGRRARERAAEYPVAAAALVARAGGQIDAVGSTHVFAAAAAGDSFAGEVVADTARHLGLALGNASNLLDPDVIVIGGGVAAAGPLLFDPLRRALASHCMPGLPVPAVVPAALGYDAGVLGALALALFEP
jgi:glucokinase